MTEEVIDGIKAAAPVVADAVSDVLQAKNTNLPTVANTPVVAPPTTVPPPVQTSSPGQSVWEKPVKLKIVGVFQAEGELKPVMYGLGGLTFFALLYLGGKAIIKKMTPKSTPEQKQNDPPTPTPPLTTNRDNIGKPAENFMVLIPGLAYCGENILIWGEKGIGKSYLGIQLAIDFTRGGQSSLFPSEQETVARHHVIYYAYELDEQMIRDRYGDYLNQFENLQIVYANPLQGQTDNLVQDLKNRLEKIPDGSKVAVFFDTFKRTVGPANCYDEKKCGEFLHELEKIQAENKSLHNRIISNIIIAHKKQNGDGLEGPGCLDQFSKTEARFSEGTNQEDHYLKHIKSNNLKKLDRTIHLGSKDAPYRMFVADEEVEEEQKEDVENPFKENGDYDWKKLEPLLKKLAAERKSQAEIARIITEKYGKETNQQSVSAAMGRLGIKPDDK